MPARLAPQAVSSIAVLGLLLGGVVLAACASTTVSTDDASPDQPSVEQPASSAPVVQEPSYPGSGACNELRPILAGEKSTVVDLTPADYRTVLGITFPRDPDCVLELTYASGRDQDYYVFGGFDASLVADQIAAAVQAAGFAYQYTTEGVYGDDSQAFYVNIDTGQAFSITRNPYDLQGLVSILAG